jgi:hypothetical protein
VSCDYFWLDPVGLLWHSNTCYSFIKSPGVHLWDYDQSDSFALALRGTQGSLMGLGPVQCDGNCNICLVQLKP